MRRSRATGMLTAFIGLISIISCDRTPLPPKAVINAQNDPTTLPSEIRPTTQELLGGTYHKFILPDMPLSIRVPESWKFTTAANMQFIEGPSPSDQIALQLANRDAVPNDRVEALITRLKDEVDLSRPRARSEIRQAGQMRILERIYADRPITNPKLDANSVPMVDSTGNPITITTTTVHWSLLIFVPAEKAWNRYELNVIGLTAEHFDADRPLIEKVLGSLIYEGSAATRPN